MCFQLNDAVFGYSLSLPRQVFFTVQLDQLTDQHDVFFSTRLLSIDIVGLGAGRKKLDTTATAETTEELETGTSEAKKKKDVKEASFWEG